MRKSVVLAVIVCVALLVGGVGAFAAVKLGAIGRNLNSDTMGTGFNQADVQDALVETSGSAWSNEPFYMLLIGIDESEERDDINIYGGAYRTDSIILARIDPGNKQVTLISIHRDTMVDLSAYGGTGKDKINAAYVYGGAPLTIQVISDFAGVDISHYAEINFDGFTSVVDTLGGVEVDVPQSFYDSYLDGGLDKGYQTLNGEQALLLCRARHAFDDLGDGDLYRAAHQRLVIKAIIKKLLASDYNTMISCIETLSNYVSTDLSPADLIGLASKFMGMDVDASMYTAMEPTEGYYDEATGTWFEKCLTDEWHTMMERVDAGQTPTEGETATDLYYTDDVQYGSAYDPYDDDENPNALDGAASS